MTDPGNKPREQLDEATLSTGVMRGVRQIESLDRGYVAAPIEAPAEPVYVKEPLFSKKVLFGWGIATLMVWFAFTFIIPPIFHSVKSAIETSTEMSRGNSRTVITTPDGGTVTIIKTEKGVTVDRKGPGETVTVPAPTVEVPAPVVIPAPIPPTGKK